MNRALLSLKGGPVEIRLTNKLLRKELNKITLKSSGWVSPPSKIPNIFRAETLSGQ